MKKLIKDIEEETSKTSFFTGVHKLDRSVIDAIKSVDRAQFVPSALCDQAYEDYPLSIGFGQTISQPFIVALMTHLLEVKPEHKILEIGSGSGYQLAILAKLAREVYGIEFVPELAKLAQSNLQSAHITNAHVLTGDGNEGLSEKAPFDRIIVSAAAQKVPPKLLEQLAIGGIMVIPKNISGSDQMLIRITKSSADDLLCEDILPVRFVPLVNS